MKEHKDHGHNHSVEGQSTGNIKMALFINVSFTIIEIIGGLWTNSMAILSDALHDLGDSASLGVAWYLENYSKKKPDEKFSFGYSRFSLLGALINSMILVGGSVFILIKAIPRILNPQEINAKGMLALSILGIIMNGVAVLKLNKGKSLNEKVVLWHLMEDVLGWVVVLIVSVVLIFFYIPVLDPLLSIGITLYILYNVIKNLKEILNIFLQGVPEDLSIEEIEEEIKEKTNALSVHHTHIWSMEGQRNLLSTHIIVNNDIEKDEIIKIKEKVRKLMEEKGIEHTTLQIDYQREECHDKKCH